MTSAAKRRNFFSAFIALALLFCTSHVASANVLEISKTRAELKSNLAENHVSESPFYAVKRGENYDAFGKVALESSVAPNSAADDFITVFRGDRPGTTVIKSNAARQQGYAGSQRLIDEGNLDDLFRAHAADSASPASPFISTTTDRRVAEFFAGPNGVVNEFRIPRSRATPNPFNDFQVPAGPGGSLIPEAEFLVPNYIRPSEFLRWP